jgi:hypothetical protein
LSEKILRGGARAEWDNGKAMGIVREVMRRARVVEVGGATSYYFDVTTEGDAPGVADFPNLAPPFATFFLESEVPDAEDDREETGIESRGSPESFAVPRSWGVLFDVVDLSERADREGPRRRDPEVAFSEDARWLMGAALFADYSASGEAVGPIAMWQLPIAADGRFEPGTTAYGEPTATLFGAGALELDDRERAVRAANEALKPMLFAICCFHCIRAARRTGEATAGTAARPPRRGLSGGSVAPDLAPVKELLDSEGEARKVGLKGAMRRCRQHFAASSPFS